MVQQCAYVHRGMENFYWKQRRKYKSYKKISLSQLSMMKIKNSLELLTRLQKATPRSLIGTQDDLSLIQTPTTK